MGDTKLTATLAAASDSEGAMAGTDENKSKLVSLAVLDRAACTPLSGATVNVLI